MGVIALKSSFYYAWQQKGDRMIVYGDLLFLINFSMDFLCFYIACLLLHKRIAIFRTCLASVIGGIYSVAALFIKTQGGIALFLDISVLAFMCAIVFATKNTSLWWMLKAIFLFKFILRTTTLWQKRGSTAKPKCGTSLTVKRELPCTMAFLVM